MRFQLLMSLLVSFSTLGASAIAKEMQEAKQEVMYVQCQYRDVLNGSSDYQWAVDQNEAYVAILGTKNSENQFVTHHNEQLVKDYCTYTKRAHYGDDRSVFFQEVGIVASPSSFEKSVPLLFESQLEYPDVDPDWAQNLKPGKVKPKNYHQLMATKAIGVAIVAAGMGLGFSWYGDKFYSLLGKITYTGLAAFAVVDFVSEEAFSWDKAGKVLEKADKASDKFKPKKIDEKKELLEDLQIEALQVKLKKQGLSTGS